MKDNHTYKKLKVCILYAMKYLQTTLIKTTLQTSQVSLSIKNHYNEY